MCEGVIRVARFALDPPESHAGDSQGFEMSLRPPRVKLPNVSPRIAAPTAAVVLGACAFTAIQMFGDPSAAGPRRIISLSPGGAEASEAAPTLSLSDAAAEGAALDPLAFDEFGEPTAFGPDGEPLTTPGEGELRVAVVGAPDQPRRQVSPLARAPIELLHADEDRKRELFDSFGSSSHADNIRC